MTISTKYLKRILKFTSKAVVLVTLFGVLLTPAQIDTSNLHSFGTISIKKSVVEAYAWCSAGNTVKYELTGCPTGSSDITADYEKNPSKYENVPQADKAAAAAQYKQATDTGLTCTLNDPANCLANVIYAFTVGLGGGLAYVGGFILDMTVSLSLNSVAYALTFLSAGWTTARDLANMGFILILVYIAYLVMFQAETAGTMRMLAWVIFIALIINFSFFLTRIVIDSGNILAVQFYNAIDAPMMSATFGATNAQTGVLANSAAGIAQKLGPNGVFENTKDLTAGVMQALNISELFSNTNFQNFARNSGFGVKFITLAFLYLSIGACYFILAAMFIAVGIKFLVRIVVLWFLIIAAPLAFIARALPSTTSGPGWYDMWQAELVKNTFYPAIFLFIFLFVNTVMSGLRSPTNGILSSLAQDLNTAMANPNIDAFTLIASSVANVGIRLGFVIAMLYIALKASEYVGARGATIAQKATSFAFGQTGRLAAMPGRLLGQNTFGRAGIGLASASKKFENRALLGSNAFSRAGWRGLKAATGVPGEKLSKASYDIRNAPGGSVIKKGVEKITGGPVSVGSPAEGGIVTKIKERTERIKKEREARAKLIKERESHETIKELIESTQKHDILEAKERGGTALSASEKADKRALKSDIEKLSSKFNTMDKGKIDSIKFADLEKVLKHAKEGVIKKIEESDKHSDKDKSGVRDTWENASLNHSQDIVQGLKQIHADLTTRGAIPGASLSALNISTTTGTLIDSDQVKDLLKELKVEIPKARQRMTLATTQADKDREQESLTKLQEARDFASKLDSTRKGVPDGKGSAPKAEEFLVA